MFNPSLVNLSPILNLKFGSQKRIGIINRGKDTRIINCEFENLDVAIQNEGKNMISAGNKIK